MTTLNEIADAVHANAIDKGFHDMSPAFDRDHFIDSQTNNLHDEVSELHEAWRRGDFDKWCDKFKAMSNMGFTPLTCAEEEYADILIRVLDQCARLDIDIQRAIETKHEYNKTRPHRHGGKLS